MFDKIFSFTCPKKKYYYNRKKVESAVLKQFQQHVTFLEKKKGSRKTPYVFLPGVSCRLLSRISYSAGQTFQLLYL